MIRASFRGRSTGSRVLGVGVVLVLALPAAAFSYWPQPPSRDQVRRFLDDADSVVVWSITLPDSVTAGERRDAEVLDVAPVRKRIVASQGWGRAFAAALLGTRDSQRSCDCRLVRDHDDSSDVVVHVLEYRAHGEPAWMPVVFRDSCAALFFAQGRWGTIAIGPNARTLMRLIREVLPGDSAYVSDSVLSRERPNAKARPVLVQELPEMVETPKPEYPDDAREQGIDGTVNVLTLVGKSGSVEDVRVVWSIPALDEAALSAVRRWRFKPARSDGQPVAVWVLVPVRFKLH